MPLYGSNYGFGQALAGVPQAYMQGKQLGMQMQEGQLALQEAQRKAQAGQAYDEAMALPEEQPTGGLGYPQPDADPNQSSPYFKTANLINRRLALLKQRGGGMYVPELEKQLQETISNHHNWLGQKAADAIESGSLDTAKKYLGAMGLPVESIAPDASDDRFVVVTSGGAAQRIPREQIALVASGGAKALEVLARTREGWGKIEQRGKAAEEREKTKRMEIERKWQEWSGEHGKQDLEWAKLDMRREQGRAQIGARYAAINKPPSNVDAQFYLDLIRSGSTPEEAREAVNKFRIEVKEASKKSPEEAGADDLAKMEQRMGFIRDPNIRAQRLKAYVEARRRDTRSSNPESTEPKPMPASKRPGSKPDSSLPPGFKITKR